MVWSYALFCLQSEDEEFCVCQGYSVFTPWVSFSFLEPGELENRRLCSTDILRLFLGNPPGSTGTIAKFTKKDG